MNTASLGALLVLVAVIALALWLFGVVVESTAIAVAVIAGILGVILLLAGRGYGDRRGPRGPRGPAI